MKISLALLGAGAMLLTPTLAAAQPAAGESAGQGQGANKAQSPAANSSMDTAKAQLACDSTATSAKAKGSNSGADPRPESVRSITRDSGAEAASSKKSSGGSVCAAPK
jgi:hypothetical protein